MPRTGPGGPCHCHHQTLRATHLGPTLAVSSLPALKIHSRYPFSSRSICCCLRSFRKARRFSTLSRSLANSLQREKNKKAHHIKSGKIRRPYFAIEIVFTKPVKSIAAGTTAHYTLLPSKVLLCFYLSSFSAPHPAGGLQSPKWTQFCSGATQHPCQWDPDALHPSSQAIQITIHNTKSSLPSLSTT